MNTQSRTVRVFLSSTFRDFAEERDLLVRKVFPELRRRCQTRQVELVDVDLRWGITEQEAQQGKVLPICLAEIDRSRPFFMGFIGERYGWVPEKDQYDLSLIMEQSWLDEHRGGKSVTELEMLHGVLNNPAMEDRAFFYFRDEAYSISKGGAYLSESKADKAKLEALKDRIRKSGYPVVENYASPEALAERVKEDLWRLIDDAFPESEVPDALARERMRHEAFTASRLGLYIGGDPYFSQIDSAMLAEARRPVLVTGDSGGGKSALLANWASRFSQNNPSAILLTHCLATGADAAQPVNMAVRILREISRITGEQLVLEGDPRKALHMLSPWLAKAGAFAIKKGGLFVLVLDGLDKMDAQHDMGWWPTMLPEGVGMVASCLSGKVFEAISSRMDWEKLPVSQLQREDCETFIASHLGKYRKSLTPELTSKVVSHPLSGNPLFLRTLLEELRVFGVHEELGPKLDHYLTSQTVDDLFERVLERVETDNSPESLRAALEVLWAAKESFAEDELLAVSGLPPAVWAPIHIALDESLIGAGGRLAFSHDYLRKAVEDRYLSSAEDRRHIQTLMAEFCAQGMSGGKKDISHYVRRHAVEHFLEVADWDSATAALSDLDFIEARAIAQELPPMLKDYAEAVQLLPEGEKERQMEAARQAELDRYAREMYEYAATWTRIREGSGEAEPTLPRPIDSVRLWTEDEIATERKRMTKTPNLLDILKSFRVFVATNSAPLQQFSTQEGFAANLARNDAPIGPVHEEGKRLLEPLKCIKLIKQFLSDDVYNPLTPFENILDGHNDGVSAVQLSADGKIIASGSYDGIVRIWDAKSGLCIKTLAGHKGSIWSLAVTSDGKHVVSGGTDKTLRVWNIDSGKCTLVLNNFTDTILSLSFSPDGKRIASGCRDGTLCMWKFNDEITLEFSKKIRGSVTFVKFSADGNLIIFGGRDIHFLEIKENKTINIIKGYKKIISSIALDANNDIIVSGYSDGSVGIVDIKSSACISKLIGHTAPITSVFLSSDGKRIISASQDETIRVWDTNSSECIKVLKGHGNWVLSLSASSDAKQIISGGWDNTIRIWDAVLSGYVKINHGHEKTVRSAAFAPDGKFFGTGGKDNVIKIWCSQTLDIIASLKGHQDSVHALEVSSDGKKLISGSQDETIRIWSIMRKKCLRKIKNHDNWVNSIKLTSDSSRFISGDLDSKVNITDTKSGMQIASLKASAWCNSIAIHPNNKLFILGSGNLIQIWDAILFKCLRTFNTEEKVASLSICPKGKYIISKNICNSLQVWDIETGVCIRRFNFGRHYHFSELSDKAMLQFYPIEISACNNYITSCNWDDTLHFWNSKTDESAVFFLRGISTCKAHWGKRSLICGYFDGRVDLFKIENTPFGSFITNSEYKSGPSECLPNKITARPPCCGQLISIPAIIAERIEHWAMEGGEGGEGGYTDPALLLDCPSCGTPLRMNPFFANL